VASPESAWSPLQPAATAAATTTTITERGTIRPVSAGDLADPLPMDGGFSTF